MARLAGGCRRHRRRLSLPDIAQRATALAILSAVPQLLGGVILRGLIRLCSANSLPLPPSDPLRISTLNRPPPYTVTHTLPETASESSTQAHLLRVEKAGSLAPPLLTFRLAF